MKDSNWLMRNWSNNPVFRTALALAVLAFAQAVAIHSVDASFGFKEWAGAWLGMMNEYSGVGLAALGMSFVIAAGGADLSTGAVAAAASAVASWFLGLAPGGAAYAAALAVCAISGAAMGQATGNAATRLNAPPIVATLGLMPVYGALARLPGGPLPDMAAPRLPAIYWAALAILAHVALTRTVFGKHVVAAGCGEEAARLSGVDVGRVRRAAYTLCGVAAALSGVMPAPPGYGGAGIGGAMAAMAACILGGARLGGGGAYASGTVMGTMVVAIVDNMPWVSGAPAHMGEAVKGALVIGAVMLQMGGAQKTGGGVA